MAKPNADTMIIAKALDVPDGFTAHDGDACPVDPEQRVELLIRTYEGVAISGIVKAKLHQWSWGEHAGDFGEILAYRIARKDEV